MTFDLETGLDLLTRTPTVLDALLRGLDDTWSRTNEGPETWTAFGDTVGPWRAYLGVLGDRGPR
jgi:hypothetical protein